MTPEFARDYIKNFKYTLGIEVDHVQMDSGEVIYFDKMTDEQAVIVAKGLIDIELEALKKGLKQ